MSHKKWWEIYSKLEDELQELEKAGIKYSLDKEALAIGVVRLELPETVAGEMYVIFPDLYPYFRFEIYAPELDLKYHQNPFDKNLCIIGRSTYNWIPSDTVASFIIQRLPDVINTAESNDREEVATKEERQAEPLSDYYSPRCLLRTSIIADGSWVIEDRYKSGKLIIGTRVVDVPTCGWAVVEIQDENRNVLACANKYIRKMYSGRDLSARWIRLDEIPLFNENENLFNYLSSKDPFPQKIEGHRVKSSKINPGGKLKIRAALFPEETHAWRKSDQGWLFASSLHIRKSYG